MRRAALAALLLSWLLTSVGCNWIAAAGIMLGPRRIAKTEYKLTTGKLAVLIDYARPDEQNPVFDRALFDTFSQIVLDQRKFIPSQIVPFEDVLALQRKNRDFRTWSMQRVGRELAADEVLYVKVQQLQMKFSDDTPMVEPRVALRIKVIGVTDAAENARLFPKDDADGRLVECSRQAEETPDAEAIDRAATKLGKDTAQYVAHPFYDVDEETPVPKER